MAIIIIWLVIGVAVGAAVTSFRSGAGTNLSFPLAIGAGIIGSVAGAVVFGMASPVLFGRGPEFMVSLLGAAIVAVAAVLILQAIKK